MDKRQSRKYFKGKRKSLSEQEYAQKSFAVCHNILNHFKGIERLLGFYPIAGEPQLTTLFSAFSDRLYLPKCFDDFQMEFFRWSPGEQLIQGKHGISEPCGREKFKLESRSLCLVPALAVDKLGVRLGYGGGYYDRFLARQPDLISLGIIFEQFFVEELPSEPHDIHLDFVVTENEVRGFS